MRKSFRARRDFLARQLPAVAAGAGLAAIGSRLNLVSSALAANTDYSALPGYKALVCVFLYGGSDSFNMFVPYDAPTHASYSAARTGMSVPHASLLPATDNLVGFNPYLPQLRNLYDGGQLALLRNVGNLIAPVERSQFLAETAVIPTNLFAHNHQQEQWQKGLASQSQSTVGAGWGGRMADLLMQANPGALAPSLSMDGANYFLPGYQSTPVAINPVSGPQLMRYLDPLASTYNEARGATIDRLLAMQSNHPIEQYVGDAFVRARNSARIISQVLATSPDFNTPYDAAGDLSAQLRMVARLIAGHDALGAKRQIFFVGLGGWDTHDNQTARLQALMTELDDGLSGFYQTLSELNINDQVTTFTASDFGRSLTMNNDGTDHGWGGHYLVMGDAVQGGQLIGDWPDFTIDGPDDSGDKGRIIPRISVNQYGASLASWMGLSNADIAEIFPDLANFSDTSWQQQYGMFRNI